ncbi:hypothetical protein MMC15_006073 [Xylographa vitiligo]|nr:hypothetical protein [Xylographa vitiligo]
MHRKATQHLDHLQCADPQAVFYGEVAPPITELATTQLKPEPENVLSTPTAVQAWSEACYNGRRAYVHILLDERIPAGAQSGMLAGSAAAGDVYPLETGHSPFLSQPGRLSRTLVEMVERWR